MTDTADRQAAFDPTGFDATVFDPTVFDIVHADLLTFYAEEVATLGGDAAALLRTAAIDPDALSAGTAAVGYRQLFALLERTAATLPCPDFGLRLAERQGGWRTFGPLGPVMRHSATLGQALAYVAEHSYAHSTAARIRLIPLTEGNVVVAHDILTGGFGDRAQAMEQTMMLGHLGAQQLTGGYARGRKILLRHQPTLPAAAYRRRFGCDVLFGQPIDGMVFSEADLEARIVDPDAHVYRAATDYIESEFSRRAPPLPAQVRALILQYLGSGAGSNDRIAAELGLHPRTLHRRLAREGTSFRRIKDAVRREIMVYDLQHSSLELARISEKLGFAEQSVMTRRCHRWFATSPTKLRESSRPLAPAE